MCKELLKMAADESPCHSSKSASTARCKEAHAMPQAPPPPPSAANSIDQIAEGAAAAALDHSAEGAAAAAALNHNAGRASAARPYILQTPLISSASQYGHFEYKLLHNMQITAGHNSIDGSASVINSDINPSLISTNHADSSSPRPGVRRPLQLQLLPHDHEHLQEDHQMSSIARPQIQQSPSKKLHARCSTKKEEEGADQEEAEEEEEAGDAEEEGCVTPTGRYQRIPQYNQELNYTSGLVCPPAPKKKPCASKRRRLIYSADDHGAVNYHIAAERRPFLVDPPDLHTFPDCIRALFK